jgi:hypothetical protein
MPRPEPIPSRGQLRAWLKMAVQSTMLDRVPADYEPDGPGTGGPTREYARGLLARWQALDPGTTPPTHILAETCAFRVWVEARQRTSRRLILAEEDPPVHRLGPEPWSPSPPPPVAPPPRRSDDRRPPTLLDHPLWDRWLDG